jgi:hypothetical protein
MHAQGRFHERSFVCAVGHELRVTARCVQVDLSDSPESQFERLVDRHDIVRAFLRERHLQPVGADTVGPADDRPLTVLRHTHHVRGATWHDEEEGVVWLCACGRHRSGQADDAFPYFERLRGDGSIWPADPDYEGLDADRGARFAAFVVADAPAVLAAARADPDTEQTLAIGLEPVTVLVRIVETMEETFVAISGINLTLEALQLLLVALYPERAFNDWRQEPRLPRRELDHSRAEFCLSIVHD